MKTGLTQEAFAQHIGVNVTKIQNVEAGKQRVDHEFLQALVANFAIDMNWLFENSTNSPEILTKQGKENLTSGDGSTGSVSLSSAKKGLEDQLERSSLDFDEFEPWRSRLAEAFEERKSTIDMEEFSAGLGKDPNYITRLVHLGTANPPPNLFLEICTRLGVSPAHIISGEEATEERDKVVRRILNADEATVRRVSRALDLFED